MGKPYKITISDIKNGVVVAFFSSSSMMKECMERLGWEDVNDIPGFIKYIIENELAVFCNIFLSKQTSEGIGDLSGEELYLLTFVDFFDININTTRLAQASFKALDYFPGDYTFDNEGNVKPRRGVLKKAIELIRFGIFIKRITIKANAGYHDNKWHVYFTNKEKYHVNKAIKKYAEGYLLPVLSSDSFEGKILKYLYESMNKLK